MSAGNVVLVVDAGNTAVKVGIFKNNALVEVKKMAVNDLPAIRAFIENYPERMTVLSSVLGEEQTQMLISLFGACSRIDIKSKLPIQIAYKTPETLGIDRICNAVALLEMAKKKKVVSIDIGTCIKFDFVDEMGSYHGGSISPGIHLRYKSLNDHTANLPLLSDVNTCPLIGKSTHESIHSGIINGIQAEINGMITHYTHTFNDLTFFVTGGDQSSFDFEGKNNIFVDENLTLKGLYLIYKFNAQ